MPRSRSLQTTPFDDSTRDSVHNSPDDEDFDEAESDAQFDIPNNRISARHASRNSRLDTSNEFLDADAPRRVRRPSSLSDSSLSDSSLDDSSPRVSSVRDSTLRDAARRASYSEDKTQRAADSTDKTAASRRSTRRDDNEYSNSPRASSRGSRNTKSAPPKTSATPAKTPPRALAYEIVGVLCLALCALLLYNVRFATDEIRGAAPHLLLAVLRALFGAGSVVVPLLLGGLGVLLIARHHRANLRAFWRGAGVAFLVLLTALHLRVPHGSELDAQFVPHNGGAIGGAMSWILRAALGDDIGVMIFLVALSLVAVLFWSELSLAQGLRAVRGVFQRGNQNFNQRVHNWKYDVDGDEIEQVDGDWTDPKVEYANRRERIRQERLRETMKAREAAALPVAAPTEDSSPRAVYMSVDELIAQENATSSTRSVAKTEDKPDAPRIEIIAEAPPISVVGIVETPTEIPEKSEEDMTPTEKLEAQALASATDGEAPLRKPLIEKPRRRFGDGPLMPHYFDDSIRALDPPIVPDVTGVEGDIHAGVEAVQSTLASFKIDARVTDVKRGPVITRYEVQPAPGVRVASIANLDRDMSRALSAIAVRIEAPVPGKDVVGIEVPNKKVHLVRLRDVLERHEFLSAPSKLAFVLGKDIAGQPKWADLTKMPHMLVAGATNSGKSVCLNTIISSIICRASPDEVKFSLIDPKRVELTLYRGIPHLYHDVVVEPKDAVKVLRGMIAEMDRRYKRFAERGVRNIVSYNQKLEEDEKPLPYIVIVIDELADLMMTAAAEFEKLICRLAQLARATGIHLIVATQRPSVNVITGVIKANIPSRIAFAVASQVDSRTILDAVGAERLIGSGDMLFDANNGGKAIRIQGAFLSEEEVNRVVEVVKAAYEEEKAEYSFDFDVSSVTDDDVNEANEKTVARDERKDDLYDEILEYIVRSTEMSASMIQRKFEIGYPRAARIVDQFERDGVLSPANGSKPRKVIGNGKGMDMS